MSDQIKTEQILSVKKEEKQENFTIGFSNQNGFELLQRVAKAFSSSELVPKQYQGSAANCMIAIDMANRIGANPLMVMQNLDVIYGTPSWSAKFLIATINSCGRFSGLRYEWKGDKNTKEYGCRAWVLENKTGERLNGVWITWEMVNSEGWASKNGSKWKTMPDQMFVYRAAAFWQRAYAPELGMGLMTTEEIIDVQAIDVTPKKNNIKLKNIEEEKEDTQDQKEEAQNNEIVKNTIIDDGWDEFQNGGEK